MQQITRLAALGVACLFAVTAHAQITRPSLPEAPAPTIGENLLFAGVTAAHGVNVYTTAEMLDENPSANAYIVPNAVADHTAALAATNAAFAFVVYRVSRLLDRHRHHRLAILVPVLDMVGVGFVDAHDAYITGRTAPGSHGEPPTGGPAGPPRPPRYPVGN